ncbi:serine/threonine-protein kinase [Streptomyces chartreusis]|uniref:serine/threonine-protein kinase n=1 Tax=Streptomyces chartreusis TaxID=1969 RepID=UPI00366283E8
MGRVWRAVDEILDRLVAVKEMRIDGLDPEDTRTRRERTLREARATARIDHPNVVRVYDVVDEGERLWIVMELVAGRSLERIMAEEGPLGPGETARIGLGLVAALRQVHDRGVLHRDIKPGNVLVETDVRRGRGRVVLTDFGIAAIQDAKALTMVGMLVGSPDYMAPERISGRPQGPPSDIWSLGATLSAALAGRSPFSRDTTLATLHAVLYEQPELPPTAGALREILTTLLDKDPDRRPGLDDLETALQPVAHPIPTPTVPVVRGGVDERGESATGAVGLSPGAGPEADRAKFAEEQQEQEQEPGTEPQLAPESGKALIPGTVAEPAGDPETGSPPAADLTPEPGPPSESSPDPVPATAPPGESPTPALLDPSRVLLPPDPRQQPDDIRDAIPPTHRPAPTKEARTGLPHTEVPYTEVPVAEAPPTEVPYTEVPLAEAPRTEAPRTEAPRTEAPRTEAPHTEAPPTEVPPAERTHQGEPTPAQPPQTPPAQAPRALNASTELAPGSRSEVHSATPAGNSTGPAPRRAGVSLERAGAVTERRPGPGVGVPEGAAQAHGGMPQGGAQAHGGMPPGEFPGPAVPAHPRPRRGHRRTGIVAAVGIAAAGAVVAVVLASDFGSPKDDDAGGSTSPSTAASSPSSTVEGTSRPQSLPPGSRREAGGFAWVPPEGWQRDVKTGSEVHYTSPDARQELAAKSSVARDDLMDSWQKSEQNAQQGKDYSKIRLERTTFRGHPAVVWEYTFTLQGEPWHAQLLGFTVGGKSYQINTWYRPDMEAQALKTYEKVRDTFTVL